MKEYINNINGITYKLTMEEVLYPQAQVILQAINKTPCTEIKDGYRIQIGFSCFILSKNADDDYTVVTCDYTKNPFKDTTEDLTYALIIQLEQVDVLKTYKVSGKPVRYYDKIVVAKNALDKQYLSMQRFADLGESGWCVEGAKIDENGNFAIDETKEYETCYAFQLLNSRPCLVKALMLPNNYIVVVDRYDIIEILDENNQSVMDE